MYTRSGSTREVRRVTAGNPGALVLYAKVMVSG
jgi:hypothetical protein